MPASRKRRSQRNDDDDDEAMVEAAEAVVAAAAAAQEEEAEEEEEQEAETEEGAITPSPPKRSRRNNSNNGENDENNANMADVQQEQEEEEEAQQEQEEEERAYTDDDNDNNNSNRNDNSRRIMHSPSSAGRQSINAPGKQAECGIIQQVYVENFMCHKKLRVDLCANVNFIHGQNGSGKSAILAAIQICLGAGARRTHRARNLKELIRKETSSGMAPSCAKVQVKLLNRGDDGYKPEVYGSTIIVERTIQLKSGGGYNGYKLLDEHGVEKSRSKRDLDEMLDMLNIQVENPVAVLDQEEAKKFLTGKAQDKYSFFLKATELERINRVYASTLDSVEEMADLSHKVKQNVVTLQEKSKSLKKQYEQHQQLTKLEHKVLELNVHYAWSVWNEKDTKRQQAQDKMDQFKTKAAKKQEELTQAEQEEEANAGGGGDQQGDERTRRIRELTAEVGEQEDRKRELEAQLAALNGPYKGQQRDYKRLTRTLEQATAQVQAAQQRLHQARQERLAAAGSAASEEKRRNEELQESEAQLAVRKQQAQPLKQAVSNALRLYEELEPQVHESKAAVQKVQRQLHGALSTLQELENSSNSSDNSMAVFGQRTSKVHFMVENAKRQGKFRGPVAGPIGAYIKVAPGKEVFAELAESALGPGLLDRFIVTNDADRRLFQNIRKQAHCQMDCGVFQQHVTPRYNIPAPPDVEGIETVASVLTIQDDLVFNALVDNAKIDQKGLAMDKESSEEKLLERNDSNGKLQIKGGKLREVYFLPRGDYWSVRNGAKTTISNERKFRKTISTDKTAMIEQAKVEVAELKAELAECRKAEGRLESQHTQLQKEWGQAKRKMRDNDSAMAELGDRIDQIKSEMETAANTTIDTTEYEEDVAQQEEQRAALEQQQTRLKEELEAKKPEIDTLKTRIDEVTIRNQKIMKDLGEAEEEMTQFLNTQSQRKDALERKRDKVCKYNEVIAAHQSLLDKCCAEEAKAMGEARRLHFTLNYVTGKNQESQRGAGGGNCTGNVTGSQVVTPQRNSGGDGDRDVPTDRDLEAIEPLQTDQNPEYYFSRVNRAQTKLNKERERRQVADEDEAGAYENYQRAKVQYMEKKKEFMELEKRIEDTKEDVNARQNLWLKFRDHLARNMGRKFAELLGMNKYTGELKWAHDEESLDLCVEKANAKGGGQSKDLKALSGGERSYTTICLLLAFGEALETPFRVLDEFDVFLDPQVRKLTIRQLIHVAKQMQHRQFIFITPQDLSGIKADPQLRILKLNAPQRHDAAGGPSQQTINFSQA